MIDLIANTNINPVNLTNEININNHNTNYYNIPYKTFNKVTSIINLIFILAIFFIFIFKKKYDLITLILIGITLFLSIKQIYLLFKQSDLQYPIDLNKYSPRATATISIILNIVFIIQYLIIMYNLIEIGSNNKDNNNESRYENISTLVLLMLISNAINIMIIESIHNIKQTKENEVEKEIDNNLPKNYILQDKSMTITSTYKIKSIEETIDNNQKTQENEINR